MKKLFFFQVLLLSMINISYSQYVYENPVYIKNNSTGQITNIQILIKLNTYNLIDSNMMQGDGSDIAFTTDCNATSYLLHYLEGYINTDSTKIWLKIPSIGPNDSILVYLRYGKPETPSLSTLNVFEGPWSSTDSLIMDTSWTVSSCQRGFRFYPNQDVLLTHLGKRVPNSTARYVTLFDFQTQSILRQLIVDGGVPGQYNYNELSTPIWLQSNHDYVMAVFNGVNDMYYNGWSTQTSQHLTYVEGRHQNMCSQNSFPTQYYSLHINGIPDFLYYVKNTVSPAPTYRILPVADSISPSAPSNFTATPGNTEVLLKWNRNSEIDIDYYKVYYNLVNNPNTASFISNVNHPDTSFMVYNLINGTTYYFWVKAVDRYCNPKTSVFSSAVSSVPGIYVYNVPELIYYKFKNNTISPSLFTPNFGSVPVGFNPSPLVGLSFSPDGQYDSCLSGAGDIGAIVNTGWPFTVGTNWTISFWIKDLVEISPSTTFYLFGDNWATQFRCLFGGTAGTNIVSLRCGTKPNIDVSCPMPGQYVLHFVKRDSTIKIYKNGVFVDSCYRNYIFAPGYGLNIGGYLFSTYGLKGKMDEFRLYNRALDSAEIATTWNHELPHLLVKIEPVLNKVPDKYCLYQNYPNPFNPGTNIRYQIIKNCFVTLKIYDILGREVQTLVNEKQSTGVYEIRWDAASFANGVYFYRMQAGEFTDIKKMILLK